MPGLIRCSQAGHEWSHVDQVRAGRVALSNSWMIGWCHTRHTLDPALCYYYTLKDAEAGPPSCIQDVWNWLWNAGLGD